MYPEDAEVGGGWRLNNGGAVEGLGIGKLGLKLIFGYFKGAHAALVPVFNLFSNWALKFLYCRMDPEVLIEIRYSNALYLKFQ